jgi:coenzyme Q-binding protein COQ10
MNRYSKEQLFEVVSRVEDYHLFVPACVKSEVIERNSSHIRADLEIGIPPLIWEKYTSRVTFVRPNIINAQCIDGKIFKHLETQWKFTDGLPNLNNSCTLDFSLSFEFRSHLHSQLAHVFFDEMARQTVNAFLKRAEKLYGKQNFYINNELPNKT